MKAHRHPLTFSSLIEVMKTLGKYWYKLVELPPQETGD
jgi:hypothetical protein